MVTPEAIAETVVTATFVSALYAVIAIGFTLIFGVGGILNFAHGAFITVGAFAAFLVTGAGYLNLPEATAGSLNLLAMAGLVAGTVAGALVAAVTYVAVVRLVRDRPVTVLILTFVVGFVILYVIRIWLNSFETISATAFNVQQIMGSDDLNNVFIFVTSLVLIGLLIYFVNYTRTGRAIVAVSQSDKGAALVGINAERINLITWTLAGAFAGYAGVLLASRDGGSWLMSILPPAPLVLSFAIVILGGLGSIKGSIVGAYIIGFFETFVVRFAPSGDQLAGVASLVLLVLFLLAKPEGLFGRGAAE